VTISLILGNCSTFRIWSLSLKDYIKRVDIAAMATMFVFAASASIIPISLVRISKELNFSLTQGGSLGFISAMAQFVVLLISSYLAGKYGKLRLIKVALLILSLGLFLFTKSSTFLLSTILVLIIGFGQGFLEGLLTPLVEDLHPGDNGKKMNLLHAFWPIGVTFSVLFFGELLTRGTSWRVIFVILALVVLIIVSLYPSSKTINLPKSRTEFSHMGEIISKPRFWFFGFSLFFAGGAESAFAFWSASYIQLEYNTNPRAGAIGAALFAIGMVLGRLLTSRIAHRFKLKNIILISSLLSLGLSIVFFFIINISSLFILMLFMGLTIACLWPSIQSYAGSVMGVDITILMIFLSCFGTPGYSSATILMGIIGDKYGLHTSFILSPIYLFLLAVVFFISTRFKDSKKTL